MLETEERLFSERDLLLGILWEGDAQLHTNRPGMAKTPFGSTIVHGNSVTSMVLGQLLRVHFKSAEKIRIRELTVNYLAPVHVGDAVKGVFVLEESHKISDDSKMLRMNFEILKNQQTRVSQGSVSIEME